MKCRPGCPQRPCNCSKPMGACRAEHPAITSSYVLQRLYEAALEQAMKEARSVFRQPPASA